MAELRDAHAAIGLALLLAGGLTLALAYETRAQDRAFYRARELAAALTSAPANGPASTTRVIVPAFQAGRTIRGCVRAISESEPASGCEIVVVDDGENGDLAGELAGLPVTIVSAFSGSAAAARNRGAEDCTARWLVFIDADVFVESTCLDRLLAPLRDGRAQATVGNYSCATSPG